MSETEKLSKYLRKKLKYVWKSETTTCSKYFHSIKILLQILTDWHLKTKTRLLFILSYLKKNYLKPLIYLLKETRMFVIFCGRCDQQIIILNEYGFINVILLCSLHSFFLRPTFRQNFASWKALFIGWPWLVSLWTNSIQKNV